MSQDIADNIFENIFESLLSRYQIGLEISIKGSDLIFDCVILLYYKSYKIKFNRGGSYLEFPDRIKNKKVIINTINKNDNKSF